MLWSYRVQRDALSQKKRVSRVKASRALTTWLRGNLQVVPQGSKKQPSAEEDAPDSGDGRNLVLSAKPPPAAPVPPPPALVKPGRDAPTPVTSPGSTESSWWQRDFSEPANSRPATGSSVPGSIEDPLETPQEPCTLRPRKSASPTPEVVDLPPPPEPSLRSRANL